MEPAADERGQWEDEPDENEEDEDSARRHVVDAEVARVEDVDAVQRHHHYERREKDADHEGPESVPVPFLGHGWPLAMAGARRAERRSADQAPLRRPAGDRDGYIILWVSARWPEESWHKGLALWCGAIAWQRSPRNDGAAGGIVGRVANPSRGGIAAPTDWQSVLRWAAAEANRQQELSKQYWGRALPTLAASVPRDQPHIVQADVTGGEVRIDQEDELVGGSDIGDRSLVLPF